MSADEHGYTPASDAGAQLPPALQRYLDGRELLHKTQALQLATVDAEGWPHVALLSAGEMLALDAQRLRFALFAQSTAAANLARDARVQLSLVLDGGVCELRLRVRRLQPDHGPLALFEGTVDRVRLHRAPYADLGSGIDFRLHRPDDVLPRWQHQLEALRRAG